MNDKETAPQEWLDGELWNFVRGAALDLEIPPNSPREEGLYRNMKQVCEVYENVLAGECRAPAPQPANLEFAIERIVRRLAGNLTICSPLYSEAWRAEKIRGVLESELAATPQATPTDARIQEFWNAQAEWSRATFGSDEERDHIGPLKHLAKEAVEAQVRPVDRTEIADCQFLVFDAARRSGMTLEELFDVCDQKLLVNKARKWSRPTSDNPVEHVREGTSEQASPATCKHCGLSEISSVHSSSNFLTWSTHKFEQASPTLDTPHPDYCPETQWRHECGIAAAHITCICSWCGQSYPNPEFHSSASTPKGSK